MRSHRDGETPRPRRSRRAEGAEEMIRYAMILRLANRSRVVWIAARPSNRSELAPGLPEWW